MAVPTTGDFSMFGSLDNTTIAGAIVQGGADFSIVDNMENFNELKALADINRFDTNFSQDATNLTQITQTIQFRGYPVIGTDCTLAGGTAFEVTGNTTTTTTSTTLNPTINCGTPSSYSGGQTYPTTQFVNLGTAIGNVVLTFNAFGVPDRFIVTWNGSVVIDTGYRGSSAYDFGGTPANRNLFISSLVGKIDPITSNTYPDFVTWSDDGYPLISGIGSGTASFNKNLTNDTNVTIDVYGPISGTEWNYQMACPT